MVLYDDDDGVHVSSYVWDSAISRRPTAHRITLLKCHAAYPVAAYVLAVATIQRFFRGVLVRRRVLAKFLRRDFVRAWKVSEESVMSTYSSLPTVAPSAFDTLFRRVQARWRAVLMQTEFQRWLMYERHNVYYVAATIAQRAWSNYRHKTHHRHHKYRNKRIFFSKEDAAAGTIQSAFRSHTNKQVFRFYVDLIKFRERGDPRLMLRCINPMESSLFDAASGLHVRFRLGGANFPPSVYYKIFVHGAVADVGAMAPKDYVRARQNKPHASVHTHAGAKKSHDRTGWYRRQDNNEWRTVSDSILRHAEEIATRMESRHLASSKSFEKDHKFHYSKLQRGADRHAKVKQHRRKWLVELYSQEQLDRNQKGGTTRTAVVATAKKVFEAMSEEDIDREVQRLIQWTEDLDFAKYRQDWIAVATSGGTDAHYA